MKIIYQLTDKVLGGIKGLFFDYNEAYKAKEKDTDKRYLTILELEVYESAEEYNNTN